MPKISRDKIKKRGFKRFLNSFKYSIDGLIYAYKFEQSLLIHFISTIFIICFGFYFKIKMIEWAIIGVSLGFLLSLELLNTAIEATVDMITIEIHPLAKIAKDCGSAAAFVGSIIVIIACGSIFMPYFINIIS